MINEKPSARFDNSASARENYVREQVSRLTGIPAAEVLLDEVVRFVAARRNDPGGTSVWLEKMYQKYFGINLKDPSWIADEQRHRKIAEISQGLAQYSELFTGEQTSSLSYGTAAPTYIEQLKKLKTFLGDKPSRSLLIGALSLDTIHEYESLTKAVLPQVKTFVTDIKGYETRQAENFALGDGLSLPYTDDSFDVLQTNYLMHSMVKNLPISLTIPVRRAYFAETYRVLKPGGLLLMVEGNHDAAVPLAPGYLVKAIYKRDLTEGGYQPQNIEIEPAKILTTRQDMHRFFHDSTAQITDFDSIQDPACLVISARK